MFCSREVHIFALDCECHTLKSTTFTYDELYKVYLVMRNVVGSKDVFSALINHLRQVTIVPTHVYLCYTHNRSWVSTKYPKFRKPGCGTHCVIIYDGCVNDNILVKPGLRYNPKQLMANCYDSNGVNIECAELSTYFPKDCAYGHSYDSVGHSDDDCTSDNCICDSDDSSEWLKPERYGY